MSFFRSDDPGRDFDKWDAEQARLLEQLPKCDICDHPIQDDHYYRINGENYCPSCLEYFRKEIKP